MKDWKHLTLEQRKVVSSGITNNYKLKIIGENLQIDSTSVSKEVKRNKTIPKNKSERKEQLCRINRTYQNFLKYKENNNISSYVEMDTVEGTKGKSALLTLNYIPFNFMIAYKINEQTIYEVTDKINKIKNIIGLETFHKIFSAILTDNGKNYKT